jgi:hypothetical protein
MDKLDHINIHNIIYNIVFLLVFLSIKQWGTENQGYNEKFCFYEKLQYIVKEIFLQEDVLKCSFINKIKPLKILIRTGLESQGSDISDNLNQEPHWGADSIIHRYKQEITDELLQDSMIKDCIVEEKIIVYRGNYTKLVSTVKKVDRVFILRVIRQSILKHQLFVNIPFIIHLHRENKVELLMNTILYFIYHYSFENNMRSEYYYKKKFDEFLDELYEDFRLDLRRYKYENEFSLYNVLNYLGGCFGCMK